MTTDSHDRSEPSPTSSSQTSSSSCRKSVHEGESGRDFFIYATIRYDPILIKSPANTKASFNRASPFYLLEHQWTRLQVANWCTSFYRVSKQTKPAHGNPSVFLHGLLNAVRQWHENHPHDKQEALRIKLCSHVSGRIFTEIKPISRLPLDELFKSTLSTPDKLLQTPWTVIIDAKATEISESTMYKTSDRYPYDRARAHAQIWHRTIPREVLLYNDSDEILDGSTSTPYFFRNGKWTTPASSCGGLQGITRRWALENGLAVEGVILKDSLTVGEKVWFSNGSTGFFHATYAVRENHLTNEPSEDDVRFVATEMAKK